MKVPLWQELLMVAFIAAVGILATGTAAVALEKRFKSRWLPWVPSEIVVLGPLSYYCISRDVGWFATFALFSGVILCAMFVGYYLATLVDPDEYELPAGPPQMLHLKVCFWGLAAIGSYAFFIFQAVWIPILLWHRK